VSPIDTGPPLGSIGPVGPDGLWILDGEGLFVIDPTGSPATELEPPQSGDALADVLSVDFMSADRGWVVASGNVRLAVDRTVDGGASWQSTWLPLSEFPRGYDAAQVSFATPLDGFLSVERYGGGSVVLASTDGGTTWTVVDDDAPVVAIRFETAMLGWGLSPDDRTLYRTDDGGVTWRAVHLGAPTSGPGASSGRWESVTLPVFHGSDGVLLAGAGPGNAVVEITGDDGNSWHGRAAPFSAQSSRPAGPTGEPFAVVSANHFIYWGGGELYDTTDSGRSWRAFRPVVDTPIGGPSAVTVGPSGSDTDPLVFSSATTGWAVATSGRGSESTTTLLVTEDGGRHFWPIAAPT
jgi:photosystem II stability/assembly factor-like uncharacterized protein